MPHKSSKSCEPKALRPMRLGKLLVGSKRGMVNRKTGSTLFLILAVMILAILVFITGSTFYGFFTAQRQLEERLQLAALLAARQLNANDNAGQINNMTAASRQLLFNSREQLDAAAKYHPEILPLAAALADESEAGCKMVLQERKAILSEAVSVALAEIDKAKKDALSKDVPLELPWMRRGKVQLDDCVLGYSAGVDSNVLAPTGNALLYENDKKFIDNNTKLYSGNVKLSLPQPDQVLDFPLSALEAPIQGTISPLRLIPNRDFRELMTIALNEKQHSLVTLCAFLPSAVQIKAHQQVQSTYPIAFEHGLGASVAAATSGASPMP